MRLLGGLLMFLASCAPPQTSRVDIKVRNGFEDTRIVLEARAGIVSRVIELSPGETWEGWFLNPGGGRVDVELRPAR